MPKNSSLTSDSANFGAACSISYSMLEEVEIAHKLDAIETGAPASPGDSGPDPALPA